MRHPFESLCPAVLSALKRGNYFATQHFPQWQYGSGILLFWAGYSHFLIARLPGFCAFCCICTGIAMVKMMLGVGVITT